MQAIASTAQAPSWVPDAYIQPVNLTCFSTWIWNDMKTWPKQSWRNALFYTSPIPSTPVSYSLLCFISLPGTCGYLNVYYMVLHTFITYLPCQKVYSLLSGTLSILFLAPPCCLEHACHMVDAQISVECYICWINPSWKSQRKPEEIRWSLNSDEMCIC